MPLLDRSDLKYDYNWKTEPANKPRRTTKTEGETESRMFRRQEGDEVLDFINDFSGKYSIEEKKDALEIERLLRDEMTNRDMTHKEVQLWLKNRMKEERV